MVPSFKNTALIFPEMSFIQFLPLFSGIIITSSLINLHNRKTSISLKRKRYFRKKNAILLYFERPFK